MAIIFFMVPAPCQEATRRGFDLFRAFSRTLPYSQGGLSSVWEVSHELCLEVTFQNSIRIWLAAEDTAFLG